MKRENMAEIKSGKTDDLLQRAERHSGKSTAFDSSVTGAARIFPGGEAAEKAFSKFRDKLRRVSLWNAESAISSFELFDRSGAARGGKPAATGDFIKITLPGSGKDDWVEITDFHELPDEIILTIQPSHDPTSAARAATTSHFFIADSTNNFCLRKRDNTIDFYVIGLNEKTNLSDTAGILETVRNYAAANLGYFLGVQKTQWKIFTENFLEITDETVAELPK